LKAVADLLGAAVGYYTPWLGRSTTADWTIAGSHLAERCQGFILIALGESIVIIGATLASLSPSPRRRSLRSSPPSPAPSLSGGSISIAAPMRVSAVSPHSTDPGRLGRSAYHFVHPVMVAGIIVTAAADELVLSHPASAAHASIDWMILGGTALLAGHAAFS